MSMGKPRNTMNAGAWPWSLAIATAMIVAAWLPRVSAAATPAENRSWCASQSTNVSIDLRISACTAIIRSGNLSRKNLGAAFGDRCAAYDDADDYDHALQDCNQSLVLDQGNYLAYSARGSAYAGKGDYDHAIADYNSAIALRPDFAVAYGNRGWVFQNKGDVEHALADFAKAIALKPDLAFVYNDRGFLYLQKGDDQHAIADFDRATEIDATYELAFANRGVAYEQEGNYDQAVEDYSKAITLKPDEPTLYDNRGQAYENRHDHAKALADFDKALSLQQDYAEAYSDRGWVYENEGDYDRAIADFDRAVALKPGLAAAYSDRGWAYEKKGDPGNALADYQKAGQLDPKLVADHSTLAKAFLDRAIEDKAKGDTTRAFSDYSSAISLNRDAIYGAYKTTTGMRIPYRDAFRGTLDGPAAAVVQKSSNAVVAIRGLRTNPAASDTPPFDASKISPSFQRLFHQDEVSPQTQQRVPLGAGFFVSADGYVATNANVIDHASEITVMLADGSEVPATVAGADAKTDLALLKVAPQAGADFAHLTFASHQPRVGAWVVALADPDSDGTAASAGIVSATGRQLGISQYDEFLQSDTAMSNGYGGGPLLDMSGEVVGVNTAIFAPTGGPIGISFAIPASLASDIIDKLEKDGAIVRGWLGVIIQSVTQNLADSMKIPTANGALVNEVQPDSPAAKAGLKRGDAITAIDGQSITDVGDLSSRIAEMPPGKIVNITYWRDGQGYNASVRLGALPAEQPSSAIGEIPLKQPDSGTLPNDFGLTLQSGTNGAGVAVANVDAKGVAAAAGVQTGDMILEVGGNSVNTPADVEKQIAAAKASGLKTIRFLIKSGDQTEFMELSLPH
jgi:serine protease Do